jgi:hypothetical protein
MRVAEETKAEVTAALIRMMDDDERSNGSSNFLKETNKYTFQAIGPPEREGSVEAKKGVPQTNRTEEGKRDGREEEKETDVGRLII